MRLTLFLMVGFLLTASANSYSQNTRLNIKLKNGTVTELMKVVEDKSEFVFLYKNEDLDMEKKVTINLKNATIQQVLDAGFQGQNVGYDVYDRQIVIHKAEKLRIPIQLGQQQRSVTGVVTDQQGLPLPGVSIAVKGTTTGTVTNADGDFNLTLPQGAETLQFSFVGMRPQEIPIAGRTTFTVVMEEETIGIEEVVAIGYGTQRRENVTGAVATIKSEGLADRPTSSPANLLQGLSPGLTVTSQGSYPGASSNIKIRETASWQGGSAPLYVIDGFVRDAAAFAQINPNDIDNISVLKDASSAAIYGVRGGNGVILVTTKHGVEGKSSITYTGGYTMNRRAIKPRMMSSLETAQFINDAYLGAGVPPTAPNIYTPDELEHFTNNNYDWLEEVWENPWNTQHNLSVSGGTKAAKYYISGGYLHQEGATSNSFDKYNFMAKISGEVTSRISYELTMRGDWGNNTRPFWFADFGDFNLPNLYASLLTGPNLKPAFINGLPVGNFNNFHPILLAQGEAGYINLSNNSFSPTFQLKYDIPGIEGLSAKGIFAYNTTNNYEKQWGNSPYVYYFKTTGGHGHLLTDEFDYDFTGGHKQRDAPTRTHLGANNKVTKSYSKYSNYQLNFMLNYQRTFGLHNIYAFAGYEQSAFDGHHSKLSNRDYSNSEYQEISGGSPNSTDWTVAGDQYQSTGVVSYFGRIDYNYNSKYLLGITIREDGSYIFPPKNRWGFFPAISAGWNIARENFFSHYTDFLNILKLRVSWGITGTDNTSPWQWQQAYNFNPNSGNYIGSSMVPSTSLGRTINPNITWERNRNFDVGLDFSMPNGLISGTVDLWTKRTTDILGSRIASVPNTVGASLPAVNYGIASAKGLELSLSHQNQIGEFFYRATANWAISSNEYVKVDQAASVRDYMNKIGQPINGVIMGYLSEGIIRTQAELDAILEKNGSDYTIFGKKPQLGMVNFTDLRGPLGTDTPDGKIDANDQMPISLNGIPRINYGFSLTAGWKGFNVSAIFSGLAKYDQMPANYYYRAPRPWGNPNTAIWNDAWTPETALTATIPSVVENGVSNRNSANPSTFWLKNAAFLRLKSLIVDYSLPENLLEGTSIEGVRIYFSGENLHQWNHTIDWDPERGSNFAQYPTLKGFTLGLNVEF